MSAKRLARETPRAQLPEPATSDPRADDLGAVLDKELAELPDKFRTLLVLCDLRGEPQTEVASRLGLPVGTVYSRLASARNALAGQFTGARRAVGSRIDSLSFWRGNGRGAHKSESEGRRDCADTELPRLLLRLSRKECSERCTFKSSRRLCPLPPFSPRC